VTALAPAEFARWTSLAALRRRVSGLSASSSSDSLQPSPVVSPSPPRRSAPSQWRTRRRAVSRVSFWSPRLLGAADVMEVLVELKKTENGRESASGSRSAAAPAKSLERGERRPSRNVRCLCAR
jgi:hypothetical protein